jgi:hypothetical protein
MLRDLLDTHIVIYVLKRRPIEVLSIFNANASRMAISSITLAELLHACPPPGGLGVHDAFRSGASRFRLDDQGDLSPISTARLHLPSWSCASWKPPACRSNATRTTRPQPATPGSEC